MPSILFLSDLPASSPQDNTHALPQAFRLAGWQVAVDSHALRWHAGRVYAGQTPVDAVDLVWPLGLGDRDDFLDRMQLLAHSAARLINTPEAYLLLHGKLMWPDLMPTTHASCRPDDLSRVLAESDGDWILKPAAGSFGRDICRVSANNPAPLREVMGQRPGEWFVLQRYVPSIAAGEHRSLLAGGTIVGSYRRIPRDGLRANLAAGGQATAGTPADAELAVVATVQQRLLARGVGFAAIDTSGPYLVEVNVANPGGLGTLDQVYARSHGEALVASVTRWLDTAFP